MSKAGIPQNVVGFVGNIIWHSGTFATLAVLVSDDALEDENLI